MTKIKIIILVLVDILSVLCILAGSVLLGYRGIITAFDVEPLAITLIIMFSIIAIAINIALPLSSLS